MRKLASLIFVSAVLTALGAAQGFMRGGFTPTPNMYVSRQDVRKELKITDEQKSKLDAAQQDMGSQMREAFQNSGGDRDAAQAAMKKVTEGYNTIVAGILTDDQKKRLNEIFYQMQGAMVATTPDMQKTLKLSDGQVKQIKDLQDKQQAANASLFEKVQNGEIDRAEVGGMIQKNTDALKSAIEKVLTDAQKAQLKDLGGATFTPDPNEPQGFGFGRRGGGN